MKITAKIDKGAAVRVRLEGAELINDYAAHHRLSVAIALLIVKLLNQQELPYDKKIQYLEMILDLSETMAKNVLELNNPNNRKAETDKPF